MSTEDKIIKARAQMIFDQPFYACLAMKLKLEEDNKQPTFATNGKILKYNSTFAESLTNKELKGVLAHEVTHLALGHPWRRENRDPIRFNIAGDYVVNETVIKSGMKLPQGHLLNSSYYGMNVEAIYDLLPETPKQQNTQQGSGNGDEEDESEGGSSSQSSNEQNQDPGNCGSFYDSPNEQDNQELQAEWKVATSQAAQIAKGSIPSELQREIDALLNPALSWKTLLQDFVEYCARNDYNFMRPNKRYMQHGVVLPSLISEELPEVAVAIDTSGSISQQELSEFASEITNILNTYDTTVRVLYCDSSVKKEQIFTRADMPVELKLYGGGGTDFRPVFERIEKTNQPMCLIYFTDLYGDFPHCAPDYPVMWITKTKNHGVPFGTLVDFN